MSTWLLITLISSFSVLFILILLILIRKKCSKPTMPSEECNEPPSSNHNLDEQGICKSRTDDFPPRKPFFSWSDHPSLIAHALENGWPRFSFVPCPSVTPATDHVHESNVVITWEVFDESTDDMQKIRLNPGVCKSIRSSDSALSVTRTALPLPGPQFGNAPFPKEAYFEVTILPDQEEVELDNISGSETRKLTGDEESNSNNRFECLNHSKRSKIEEVKRGAENENETTLLGIGLTGGSHTPLKFPGSFPGSVGFSSTGSLYLDGLKLVENEEWGREGDVIGCGFNPAQRKVFFTLNSKLKNEIRCKTEEFGYPLYPTLAANTDVTVVVNLGQSPFRFEAANSNRTSNPCFVNTHTNNSTAANYELDSRELFSMGRIDTKWKQWAAARSSESIHVESERLSEPDLFDIIVE